MDYTHWKEPKLIVKILLEFFSHHQDTHISLLFDCLRALCGTQPGRMEDGNTMLTRWTKKIIVEDGHTGSQLVHILQLVVKHQLKKQT